MSQPERPQLTSVQLARLANWFVILAPASSVDAMHRDRIVNHEFKTLKSVILRNADRHLPTATPEDLEDVLVIIWQQLTNPSEASRTTVWNALKAAKDETEQYDILIKFINTVTKRRAIDFGRKNDHDNNTPESVSSNQHEAEATLNAVFALLETRQRNAALWEAVHELPQSECEVIILRYGEGMTLAEVAAQVGKSISTVVGWLNRALDRLKILLRTSGWYDGDQAPVLD